MTTRRGVLRLAGTVPAAILLGACRSSAPGRSPARSGELLVVRTAAGVTLVDPRDGLAASGPWRGAVAWDSSAFAAGHPDGGQTRLDVLDARGEHSYSVAMAGALTARVVAPDGRLVALTSGSSAGETYRPEGRDATTVVVAGRGGEVARLQLPGCLEPEAFSADNRQLFVLDYLPPARPESYRVRMLDLSSGQLGPLFTRDKRVIAPGGEEQMRGEGRQAVYADVRKLLFTLYTHQPDHLHTRDLLAGARAHAPNVHAFVHTLSVQECFAYCIDLPEPFGLGPADGHAIALSNGFEQPFVVDATSGTIAQIDPGTLTVRRTARFTPAARGHAAASVTPDNATLIVGAGTAVNVIRTETLETVNTWTVPAPVRGVCVGDDGSRIWVGQPASVIALDAGTGRRLGEVTVAALRSVDRVIAPR